MRKKLIGSLIVTLLTCLLSTPAFTGWDPTREKREEAAAQETILRFKKADSTLQAFFDNAYGYAVFPSIGKGGFIVGGGSGRARVYEKGNLIGYARMTQVTVGAQIGGQSYSEIIFFKDKRALENFKDGNLKFAAQASAIIVTEGASKDRAYDSGVAVFTMPKAGAMAEASIGGQTFSFKPK
jgi:lipid-binding SYLF domain-containing protein